MTEVDNYEFLEFEISSWNYSFSLISSEFFGLSGVIWMLGRCAPKSSLILIANILVTQ